MNPRRRQTVLFLLCAVVLLGAGFGSGYVYAFNGFYSPETQLDRELSEMNFNSRVLHYTNLGQRADCQRELVRRLQGQVVFVNRMLASGTGLETGATARSSVQQAQNVIGGRPIGQGGP